MKQQSLYIVTNFFDDCEYLAFQSLLAAVNYYLQYHINATNEQAYEEVRRVEYKHGSWLV